MFRTSLTVGTIGYLCFLFTMLGLNLTLMISPDVAFDFSFLCLWYGFYFGVVVRDFSDLCATSIAIKGKFFKESNKKDDKYSMIPDRHLDKNTCAICGNKLNNCSMVDSNLRSIGKNNSNALNEFNNINLNDFTDDSYGVRNMNYKSK